MFSVITYNYTSNPCGSQEGKRRKTANRDFPHKAGGGRGGIGSFERKTRWKVEFEGGMKNE